MKKNEDIKQGSHSVHKMGYFLIQLIQESGTREKQEQRKGRTNRNKNSSI